MKVPTTSQAGDNHAQNQEGCASALTSHFTTWSAREESLIRQLESRVHLLLLAYLGSVLIQTNKPLTQANRRLGTIDLVRPEKVRSDFTRRIPARWEFAEADSRLQ